MIYLNQNKNDRQIEDLDKNVKVICLVRNDILILCIIMIFWVDNFWLRIPKNSALPIFPDLTDAPTKKKKKKSKSLDQVGQTSLDPV